MKKIWTGYALGFPLALCLSSTSLFAYFIRGTHNDWQADKMLCRASYGFGNECSALLESDKPTVEFKIDTYGDWSENFGANWTNNGSQVKTSEEGLKVIELHLIPEGKNIKLEGNKAYRITFHSWDQSVEVEEQPPRLTDNDRLDLKHYTYVKGIYGGTSIETHIIIHRSINPKNIGIIYSTDDWQSSVVAEPSQAEVIEDINSNKEYWSFTFDTRVDGNVQFIVFCDIFNASSEKIETIYDDYGGRGYLVP